MTICLKQFKKILSFIAATLATQVQAIPISTFAPLPSVPGTLAVIEQYSQNQYTNTGDVPGLLDAGLDLNVNVLSMIFFPHKDILISAILPYVNIKFHASPNPLGLPYDYQLNTKNFADPLIAAQYRIYAKTGEGWLASISTILSLGIPASEYRKPSEMGIPQPFVGGPETAPPMRPDATRILQSGRGNWNTNIGTLFYYESNAWEAAAALIYKHYFGHHGFKFGSELEYDLSFGRRIFPFTLEPETEYKWRIFFMAEFLGAWTDKFSTVAPAIDGRRENSGGNLIKFAPGLRWDHLSGWSVAGQYMTSITHHTNGMQPIRFSNQYLLQLIRVIS